MRKTSNFNHIKPNIMKRISLVFAVSSLIFMGSCKNETKKDTEEEGATEEVVAEEVQEMAPAKTVVVMLEGKSGSNASGKVAFTDNNGSVLMEAKISGLEPGTHAIHLHEKADCTAEDGTSSGGHWNPTFQPHGKWGAAEGFHLGDIGNFEVDETGVGIIDFSTDQWCIGCGDEQKDILGKAVIVHQGADDFTSQPSGNAGARVSCGGVIE